MSIHVDPNADGEQINGPVFPNPDVVQLRRFHAALFKNADGGWLLFRAFEHGTQRPLFSANTSIHTGDPQLISVVAERARQAAAWPRPAVFCPPVAAFATGEDATGANLHNGLTLSAECDEAPNAARLKLTALLGEPTMTVFSGGEWADPATGEIEPKVHLHWRLGTPTRTPKEHARLKEARSLMAQLTGADTTNINSVHPIRWPGSWHTKGSPRLAAIVSETDNEIDLTEALEVLREAAGSTLFGSHDPQGAKEKMAADPQDVARALKVIPNENLKWDDWNYVGMATWGATGGSDQGGKFFADWSDKASKNDPAATAERWKHYHTSPPKRIGFGTLVYLARQHSPGWMPGGQQAPLVDPVDLWAKFDPPTLPRGVLPDIIERFAVEQGQLMGADMAGVAMAALAVCAAAIPDEVQLQVKRHDPTWKESARIWVTVVGLPSTMKTPIMSAAVAPMKRIDSEMARQYSEARAEYDRLDKKEKKLTKPPKQTRVLLQDTTIEAAQDILKDSPDGVLCYQDELSGWFGSMEKYSSGRGAAKDRAFWLEAYNGASYAVNRVMRGALFIDHLSISILGGIQPELIRQIADESADDGLLQRFLPIILKPAVGGRDDESPRVVAEYVDLIGRLHRLKSPVTEGLLMSAKPLRFDDGAQAYRQELERRHLELTQSFESINRKLAAHIGKYNGIFARLCVIWHCTEAQHFAAPLAPWPRDDRCDLSPLITEETARRVGAFLHGFLLPHALAFYVGVLGLSNDHDRLTAVAGYILARKLDKITNRDVQHGDRTMRSIERRDIESVLDQLDALGWVDRTPGPRPSSPPHWTVNPAVHIKFAARASTEAERRARDKKMITEMLSKGASR